MSFFLYFDIVRWVEFSIFHFRNSGQGFFDVSMGIGVGEKGKYLYGVCLPWSKWTSNLMCFYYINIAKKCTKIHVFWEIAFLG